MRVLLLALAASCSVVSLTAQQRAISDSDLFAFRWVASPQISPDGRQAAYVLVTVNAKHDGYETSLWLVNTDGASPPRRVTAGPRDGAPRWSAGRRAGEGTPGDVRRVRRERAAVEPRRDADLFRLGPRARVVLLPARQ